MKIDNWKTFVPFALGYLGVLAGALLHIMEWEASVWVFSVGAVLLVSTRMLTLPKTEDSRTRRLYAQLMIGSLCLLATAYLMYVHSNSWAITLIISALIDIWVSFRIK